MPAMSGAPGSSPFIRASWSRVSPLRAAIADSVSPGHTVYAPAGVGACGPGAEPPSASALAASASEGILIVWPATTRVSSGTPLAAASAPVVKLLASASDQSVSPGCTVCTTCADAGAATAIATRAAAPTAAYMRFKLTLSCGAEPFACRPPAASGWAFI